MKKYIHVLYISATNNYILLLQFKSHFRVARATAYKIIDIYAISQFYPSDRTHGGNKSTSAELDILSFLTHYQFIE